MKKHTLLTLSLLIFMQMNLCFAENNEYTTIISQYDRYVVYRYNDNVELAIIHSNDDNLTLTLQCNNRPISEDIIAYPHDRDMIVKPFENPRLTINSENEFAAVKYIIKDGAWELKENINGPTISDNGVEVVSSNIPIIEEFCKPVEMYFNINYTGNNFAKFYRKNEERYICFSNNGFDFLKVLTLPSSDDFNAFENIVYGNGKYIAVGSPEFSLSPMQDRIKWSNYSKMMYVIDGSMIITHKEELYCNRYCCGFYGGYFYFRDLYENKDPEYKRSTDGIIFDIIEKEVYDYAKYQISVENKKNKLGYIIEDNQEVTTLNRNNETYNVVYESKDMAYCADAKKSGDGWIASICNNENQKKYLTFDGIYPVIKLPGGEYSNTFSFRGENYIYIELDRQHYYRIEAQEKDNVYVMLGKKILGFERPPIIEDDRTLVPMRFLFEQMGADVEWDGSIQAATATLNDTAVTFAINDTEAEVNNTSVSMDVPARLINGKTMVPLRFLSENLGYTVTWDEATRTAIIE